MYSEGSQPSISISVNRLSERLSLLKASNMHIILKRGLSEPYNFDKVESLNINHSKARGGKPKQLQTGCKE